MKRSEHARASGTAMKQQNEAKEAKDQVEAPRGTLLRENEFLMKNDKRARGRGRGGRRTTAVAMRRP